MESETESQCCREIPQILGKVDKISSEEAIRITLIQGLKGAFECVGIIICIYAIPTDIWCN